MSRLLQGVGGILLVCCGVVTSPTSLQAGMLGATVNWQGYFFGGPSGPGTFGTFVANGTIGGVYLINGPSGQAIYGIAVGDNTVTFDYSVDVWGSAPWNPSPLSLAPTIYNGVALDFSGTSLTSVSIDPATNMVGFDSSRISFTSGQIQVDWQNLSFTPSTIVRLDVTSVPEPSAILLLGLGLAGLVFRRTFHLASKS